MSASAKNMKAIYQAKQHHDLNCPYGGEGKRVLLTGFDIERMGWEEGDVVAGLVVVASTAVATGRMRVECDAEPNQDQELVVTDVVSKEDLVPA